MAFAERTDALPLAVADDTTAIRIIEEAGKKDPAASPKLDGFPPSFDYAWRGWALWGMGDLAAADADLDRAVDIDPEDPIALLSRAGFAFATGRYETAIWDCTEAIRPRPDLIAPCLARAQLRVALGEMEEALEDLNEAARWSPDHPDLYLQRGQLLPAMARDGEALRDFGAVIRFNPERLMGYDSRSCYWRRRHALPHPRMLPTALQGGAGLVALSRGLLLAAELPDVVPSGAALVSAIPLRTSNDRVLGRLLAIQASVR